MGCRFHANSPGGVWAGSSDHTRNCAILPPAGSRSCGRTRHRTTDCIYKKRAHGSVEFTVFQFAGTCRSLRRSRSVVMPHRGLPHLRVCVDRGNCPLSARSAGATSRRECVDLLFDAVWRCRNRLVIAGGAHHFCSFRSSCCVVYYHGIEDIRCRSRTDSEFVK